MLSQRRELDEKRKRVWWLFVAVIFMLGMGWRLWQAEKLPGFSFQDGARDVLVAQRLVAGQVSWEVAPDSAGIIPNTPVLYWLIAGWYALGGLNGVLVWYMVAGALVMLLVYLTGTLLGNKETGLLALGLAALSPELIR